jgi:hypothetical protein
MGGIFSTHVDDVFLIQNFSQKTWREEIHLGLHVDGRRILLTFIICD